MLFNSNIIVVNLDIAVLITAQFLPNCFGIKCFFYSVFQDLRMFLFSNGMYLPSVRWITTSAQYNLITLTRRRFPTSAQRQKKLDWAYEQPLVGPTSDYCNTLSQFLDMQPTSGRRTRVIWVSIVWFELSRSTILPYMVLSCAVSVM